MRSGHRQQGNFVIGAIVGVLVGLGVALGVAVYVTKVPVPFVTKPQTHSAGEDEAEARRNQGWNPNAPLAGRREPEPAAPPPAAPPPAVPAPDPALAGTPTIIAPTRVPPPVTVPATPPAQAQAPAATAPRQGSGPIAVSPIRPGSQGADPLGDLARARSAARPADAQVAAVSPSAANTPSNDPFVYFVQAGAFRTQDDAHAQRARLSLMGVEARVTEREQAGRTVYRVRVGPFGKKEEADRAKSRLDGGGFESALVRVQR